MSLRTRLHRDPFVIIVPILAMLWLSWQHYVTASNANLIAVPEANNLLPNGDFEAYNEQGVPTDWTVATHGNAAVSTAATEGHYSKKSFQLDVTSYHDGDVTVSSAPISVKSGESYYFKGVYKAGVPLDFLVRYIHEDGSDELKYVQHYTGDSVWSTASTAFRDEPKTTAVQFVYRISGAGRVQFDTSQFQVQTDNVTLPERPAVSDNTVPNPKLTETGMRPVPSDWSEYTYGENAAALTYETDQQGGFLRTGISKYKSGEAKWQYTPQPVEPHARYHFSTSYRSDVPAEVVAEYVVADGTRRFETIDTLSPADSWTTYASSLEAPSDAKTVFVAVVLHRTGTVDSRNYSLTRNTKPGPLTFNRPLVSLTFDDGWESAYADGARLLDRFGYKGTFYLNPASVDTDHFINSSQVQDLQQRGHELASHAYEHIDLTAIKESALKYQLTHSHDYFTQSLREKSVDLAVPYGKSDPMVDAYARQQYASLRTTDSGENTRQNFDPYQLKILYVGRDMTPATIQQALTQAAQDHAWLILVYHRIESDETGDTITTPAHLQEQLEVVKRSQISVVTVESAMQELTKQL